MRNTTRLFLTFVAVLPVTILLAAGLYMLGMDRLEGDPRDFWRALAFAAETITTTGYGGDSTWNHPMMVMFVITLQIFGVVLVYMVVPVILIPFLEDRFEASLPRRAPKMKDHVVIYRYGAAVETLVDDLTEAGVPLVVLEGSAQKARRLMNARVRVVFEESLGDGMEFVSLPRARALIANGTDEGNAAFILMARQSGFEGEVLALVEEPYHRKPMTLAGADSVFTPRHVLGAALAARASHRIGPRVRGIERLEEHLEVAEVRVAADSPLVGKTLSESSIGAKTGAVVIGLWCRGQLEPQPAVDRPFESRDILIALGTPETLERLGDLAGSPRRDGSQRPFLVAGYGEVGQKVTQLLRTAGETVIVIDRKHREGVDHVVDILEPRVLDNPDLHDAQGVILALDNDRATLFATVVLADRAPDVPIIARVNAADNVERIHRAGADFALSISQVSGRILVHRLLGKNAPAAEEHVEILRSEVGSLGGRHPAAAGIREKTGCSVVAVEHDGSVETQFPEDFSMAEGDGLFVCGTREATQRFQKLYEV